MPVRTMCVPHTSNETPASRLSRSFIVYSSSAFDRTEGSVQDRKSAIEVALGDHERRRKREHIALADLEREPVREAAIHHLLGFAPRGDAMPRELDAEQKPDAADVGDEGMPALHLAHRFERACAELARTLEQSFV